jgi:hypothetical protein
MESQEEGKGPAVKCTDPDSLAVIKEYWARRNGKPVVTQNQ